MREKKKIIRMVHITLGRERGPLEGKYKKQEIKETKYYLLKEDAEKVERT